ncbi:MAG: quinone-interacting membrane-bound oxidoreductase complex subunit QmoC [Bacteroidota bacterium]
MKVEPDISFIKNLNKICAASANQCMQCGTCSVVCSLSPVEKPFPRKEMIWASWGLKDKLIGNPDIWLCHQCGDCSRHCPRGVKPADVLAGLRQMCYRHYARPRFLGNMLAKPAWLPVAILVPALIIALILFTAGTLSIPEGPVNYSKFFPHAWLNASFSLFTLLFYLLALSGLLKFWKDMKKNSIETGRKSFSAALFSIIGEIFLHRDFNGCTTQKTRKISHFLVFSGFILLLVVTLYAIIAVVIGSYPLGLANPFKILGNIAAAMLITGLSVMIWNRLFNKKEYGHSNYSDWLLIISMFLLTISGVLVEWARFGNWGMAYHLYFFHLVCVWFVIIYLPFTKFGHVLYRSLAMAFSRASGRK